MDQDRLHSWQQDTSSDDISQQPTEGLALHLSTIHQFIKDLKEFDNVEQYQKARKRNQLSSAGLQATLDDSQQTEQDEIDLDYKARNSSQYLFWVRHTRPDSSGVIHWYNITCNGTFQGIHSIDSRIDSFFNAGKLFVVLSDNRLKRLDRTSNIQLADITVSHAIVNSGSVATTTKSVCYDGADHILILYPDTGDIYRQSILIAGPQQLFSRIITPVLPNYFVTYFSNLHMYIIDRSGTIHIHYLDHNNLNNHNIFTTSIVLDNPQDTILASCFDHCKFIYCLTRSGSFIRYNTITNKTRTLQSPCNTINNNNISQPAPLLKFCCFLVQPKVHLIAEPTISSYDIDSGQASFNPPNIQQIEMAWEHVGYDVVHILMSVAYLVTAVFGAIAWHNRPLTNVSPIQRFFYPLLLFGCLVRAVFMMMQPWVRENSLNLPNQANIILNSLPSFLFFSAYLIVLFVWVEIYLVASGGSHQMIERLPLIFRLIALLMYSSLLTLYILDFSLYPLEYNHLSIFSTTAEQIIGYYDAGCYIATSLAFLFFGICLVIKFRQPQKNFTEEKRLIILRRVMSLSALVVICFAARAFLTIYATQKKSFG
eukprot:gene17453-20826_t